MSEFTDNADVSGFNDKSPAHPTVEVQLEDFERDFETYLSMAASVDVIVMDGDKRCCILMSTEAFINNIEPHLEDSP